MAEFCLECWNKLNGTDETEEEYRLSEELDFCEECGARTYVIVRRRKNWEKLLWKLTHRRQHSK